MASIRSIKKDIDFLLQEVVSDSYMTIFFHPERKEDVVKIIEQAVTMRNDLIKRAAKPAEKNNARLVKKQYQQIRLELMAGIDKQFAALSDLCKK